MKNTYLALRWTLSALQGAPFLCIITLVFLLFGGVCSAYAAGSGTSTCTVSEDGRTRTWDGFTYTVATGETLSNNGLLLEGGAGKIASSSNQLQTTKGARIGIEVSAADAQGQVTIIGTRTDTIRVYHLLKNDGTTATIANHKEGRSANFDKDFIRQADEKYYIMLESQADNKVASFSVTLNDAGTHPEPEECTFRMDYGAGDNWSTLCFSQVGETTEWQIKDFVLPSGDKQLWVGKDNKYEEGKSEIVSFSSLPIIGFPAGDCGTVYPGEGAKGTLRIYSDSGDKNYYIGFLFHPVYAIKYGIEGSEWVETSFEQTEEADGHKYKTKVLQLPADFSADYKYYVGVQKVDNEPFVMGRSHTDVMNTMNGLREHPAQGVDAYGVFSIYDNSCENNWYCEFIPYYQVLYDVNGGSAVSAMEPLSSEEQSHRITLPTTTREGFTFLGWYDGNTRIGGAGEAYTFVPVVNKTLRAEWELKEIEIPTCETSVYYYGKEGADDARFEWKTKPSSSNNGTFSMTVDGKEYTNDACSGNIDSNNSFSFTVSEGKTATLYISADFRDGGDIVIQQSEEVKQTIDNSSKASLITQGGLTEGRWTVSCPKYRVSMLGLLECIDEANCGISFAQEELHIGYTEESTIPQELLNPNKVTVHYTSSNTNIATIDARTGEIVCIDLGQTTISAIFDGNETYSKKEVHYTLVIGIPEGQEYTATISPEEGTTCDGGTELTIQTTEGSTIRACQWYKDNEKIKGAVSPTYTATEPGVYKAYVKAAYPQWTNNSATIRVATSNTTIKRLTPFQYYRKGCDYTHDTDHPIRHLFYVQGTHTLHTNIEGLNTEGWLYFDQDTLLADLSKLPAEGLTIGETLRITISPLNSCDEEDEAKAESIEIYIVDKTQRSLAYVVSGGDGDKVALGGDFLTGVNQSDLHLITDKGKWDMTKPSVLWQYLQGDDNYIATAVNGYAPFDPLNYEPFDIILLTDFPKTDASADGKKGADYLNEMSYLVDSKPILSLKARFLQMPKWESIGFTADMVTCDGKEGGLTDLIMLCPGHSIFHDIEDFNPADETFNLLSQAGYDNNKGLQGWHSRDLVGFVNIGYILNPADGEPLVACCERQDVLNARMMILNINAHATDMLTTAGTQVIESCLNYLLDTDPARLQDCSNIFNNNQGQGDGKWFTQGNWTEKRLPVIASNVRIHHDCTIDQMNAMAGSIRMGKDITLTVNPEASLRVAKRFGKEDETDSRNFLPLNSNCVTLKADANGSATLIQASTAAFTIPATVEYYSISSGAPDACQWQWMTTPVQDISEVEVPFAGAWLYEWNEAEHAFSTYLRNGDSMIPFKAYTFTQRETGHTYRIQGTLVTIEDEKTIPLSYNEALPNARRGINMIGNSWTAPINIVGFDEADFKNCEASIILFHTGYDPRGEGIMNQAGAASSPGQYIVIPIHTAASLNKSYQVIPAMQAFQVNATAANATLTMRYQDLVRTENVNRQPMRKWGEDSTAYDHSMDITEELHIRVEGKRYNDQVHLFCHASCTNGFDNGWDGRKILGAIQAMQLFVEYNSERYAVSTQPAFAGTQLAFYKGEDEEYTLSFEYTGNEPLFLYDRNTDRYTRIETGSTYTFRSETTNLEHRFLITDYAPETPAGPTTGEMNICLSGNDLILSNIGNQPATLSIYTPTGQLYHQASLRTPLYVLPLPDIQGVYIVEINTHDQHITRKITR